MKKLVYLYIINYAKSQPDLAILAVNTFVKVTLLIGLYLLITSVYPRIRSITIHWFAHLHCGPWGAFVWTGLPSTSATHVSKALW